MLGRSRNGASRPSSRERLLNTPRPSLDSSRVGYTAALALLVFLLVGAVSVGQTTEQTNARHLIEEGVASLTDIDQVMAEHRAELKQLAAAGKEPAYAIPGYPIDVRLTSDEIQNATDARFRQIVLERSSSLIYTNGLSAFDLNGKQSLSFFSSQGILESLIDWLSEDTHSMATTAAVVLVLLVTLIAIVTVLRNRGFGRVRALGIALLVSGIAGYGLSVGGALILGRVWGGDPFSDDLHALITAITDVPRRNYLATAGLGGFLLLLGMVCGAISSQLPASEEFADEYDSGRRR